jgi:hypothetical protein
MQLMEASIADRETRGAEKVRGNTLASTYNDPHRELLAKDSRTLGGREREEAKGDMVRRKKRGSRASMLLIIRY